MSVAVRFLGSGDAFGSGGRFQACIQLQTGETNALLDCGASSVIAMKRHGVDPATVDAVIVSHLHGDHFGGLPFLILDGQFSKRTRPLTIAGPPGIEERTRQAQEVFFPGSSKVQQRFDVTFLELEARVESSIGALSVTPCPVEHASGAPAYALRVRCADKTIAYSGDTEWTDSLLEAAADSDLFICEAYFFDKQVKFHLDYQTLMSHRNAVNTKRLVLTHMSAAMLAHQDEVDVECAHDGLEIAL